MSTELEATWFTGLRVWWAWFWRTMLIVLIVSFIGGLVVGVLSAIIGLGEALASVLGMFVGLGVGFYFGPAVFKRMMTKGFGKYRLAVVTKD